MAGETCHDDPTTAIGEEDPAKRLADGALAAGVPRQLRVRRVREQKADAFGCRDLPYAGQVGPPSVDRIQVQLEVAAVKHDALGRMERESKAARHRVCDRDELHLERADLAPFAIAHWYERRLLAQAGFVEPVACETEGQCRAIDPGVDVAQQIRERSDVVLVAVGENDPVDVSGALPQKAEVRQHQVDAGHLRIREHDAAVEDDEATRLLDDGAVAADLPEPTEKGDPDRFRHASPPPRSGPGGWSARSPGWRAWSERSAPASPGQVPSEGGTLPPAARVP